MALLGQSRDSWPSMASLGHMELTKMQKILKSKNQNENEKQNENSFFFRFCFHFVFHFCFCFRFRICFFFFLFFFFLFFFNFTMAPLGHHRLPLWKMGISVMLSGERFWDWKPFKNDEKCFSFHVKSAFCSRAIYIFVVTFRWSRKMA